MLFPYSQVCTFVYYSSLSGLMQEISYIFNLVQKSAELAPIYTEDRKNEILIFYTDRLAHLKRLSL